MIERIVGFTSVALFAQFVEAADVTVQIYDPDHPSQGYSCGAIERMDFNGGQIVLKLKNNCTIPAKEQEPSGDKYVDDPGSGDTCIESDLIKCMGTDAELNTGGTIKHVPIIPGGIHVWVFTYHSRSALEQFYSSDSPTDSNVPVEFTINKNAGSMEADDPACKFQKQSIGITSLTRYEDWACLLKEGETYFLNIHNLDNKNRQAYYTLTR